MRTISAISNDDVNAYIRLTHAAKPYFVRPAKKPSMSLEERYPNTTNLLFEVARKYAVTHQGDSLSEDITFLEIMDLLQKECLLHSDIFFELSDDKGLRANISEIDCKGLEQLFDDYVLKLQIPSYATVELLIEKNNIELAHEEALKLSHTFDRVKSINLLILCYLNLQKIDQAIALFANLPAQSDRRNAAAKIVCYLLNKHRDQEAIFFTKKLADHALRNHTFHEIALWYAKAGKLAEAINILDNINNDSDLLAYTYSLIVSILTTQGNFPEAKRIAFAIQDNDYRQDAINDIVKKMVRFRRFNEAEHFVSKLEGVIEKKEALEIISSAQKVHRQDERIKKIQIF